MVIGTDNNRHAAGIHTLLIRCAALFQSWGTPDDGRHDVRYTEKVPTKSGIVGILAGALGIVGRDAVAGELAQLRMGVRVDEPGVTMRDFQVVGRYGAGLRYSDGKVGGVAVTRRYYLADADFLVALEHTDLDMLERIAEAVRRPAYPLFLGRKLCVPGVPIWIPDGLLANTSLEQALGSYPWPRLGEEGADGDDRRPLRLIREVRGTDDVDYTLTDSPMSTTFINPAERSERFGDGLMGSRGIKESLLYVSQDGNGVPVRKECDDEG